MNPRGLAIHVQGQGQERAEIAAWLAGRTRRAQTMINSEAANEAQLLELAAELLASGEANQPWQQEVIAHAATLRKEQ